MTPTANEDQAAGRGAGMSTLITAPGPDRSSRSQLAMRCALAFTLLTRSAPAVGVPWRPLAMPAVTHLVARLPVGAAQQDRAVTPPARDRPLDA